VGGRGGGVKLVGVGAAVSVIITICVGRGDVATRVAALVSERRLLSTASAVFSRCKSPYLLSLHHQVQ